MPQSLLKSKRNFETFFKVKLASNADSTRKQYGYALKDFEAYVRETHDFDLEKTIGEFKNADVETIIDTLQGWVNKSKIETRNKKARVCFVNNYLYYRGIKIDPRDMKDLSYENGEPENRKALTLEEIQMILSHCKPLRKALYLAMLSSGMTIEEVCSIRKNDLNVTGKRIIVTIKPGYTKKNSRGRVTFLSKEAARAIKPFLKHLEDNDFVFHNSTNPKVTKENEMQSLRRTVDKLGLGSRYETGNREITSHAFRAYFKTRLNRKDHLFANVLCGHKSYRGEYDRWTPEELLNKYLEFEGYLLIFEMPVDSEEMQNLTKKNQELEKAISSMGDQLAELHQIINPKIFD